MASLVIMKASTLKGVWTQGIIPLAVLSVYFFAFSLILSWASPEYPRNVNAVFVERAGKYSLMLTAVALLIYVVFGKAETAAKPILKHRGEKLSPGDLLLVLLPIAPVVQHIINNQDILSPSGSLYVLAVFLVLSLLLVIVIPGLLGRVGSTKTLMLLGMTFGFFLTNMASFSARYNWLEEGSLKTQLLLFCAIFLTGWLLYRNLIGRKFLYSFVAVFFAVNTLVQFVPEERTETVKSIDSENRLTALIGSATPPVAPNIYLLVYDAYVINETMLEYGIDNSDQEEYLKTKGFTIYPRTYSVGAYSVSTMSRTLNVSREYYGDARRGVSGDGTVQNLLRSFGYEVYGIFRRDYFFRGIGSSYDFSFPAEQATHKLLAKAILMGEFRFDVEFDSPSPEQFREYTLRTFENISHRPRFVYMHNCLPGHSQNSGKCLPDETELFRERLIAANYQMREDIDTITLNDPGAIVIVAGDHGPYLTKNCYITRGHYDISEITRLDIQDRFGTFLAIKWPTEGFTEYDSITVHQDIFPAIFAYLFQDRRLLSARIETSTFNRHMVSGAAVKNGIILGGINDGEPLFLSRD